jgi:GxxExxY protein
MHLNEVTKGTHPYALALSHEVIGAAIEVHRVLGPGLLESVYEAALCRELAIRKIECLRQVTLPVRYKGSALDCELKLDLLIEGTIIVEVKSGGIDHTHT